MGRFHVFMAVFLDAAADFVSPQFQRHFIYIFFECEEYKDIKITLTHIKHQYHCELCTVNTEHLANIA